MSNSFNPPSGKVTEAEAYSLQTERWGHRGFCAQEPAGSCFQLPRPGIFYSGGHPRSRSKGQIIAPNIPFLGLSSCPLPLSPSAQQTRFCLLELQRKRFKAEGEPGFLGSEADLMGGTYVGKRKNTEKNEWNQHRHLHKLQIVKKLINGSSRRGAVVNESD